MPSSACKYDLDRKSTRLNSSHLGISYAVFCLKYTSKRQRTHGIDGFQSIGEVMELSGQALDFARDGPVQILGDAALLQLYVGHANHGDLLFSPPLRFSD